MQGAATVIVDGPDEARAFADSVAGVLDRVSPEPPAWAPGRIPDDEGAAVAAALAELGWGALARDPQLVSFAGLGAVALGRRLAPPRLVDALLGGGPTVGELARSLGSPPVALVRGDRGPEHRAVLRSQPCPSAEGLTVHRVLELGAAEPVSREGWPAARAAWLAASVGYLAGLGRGALELTVDYVRRRRAFASTLAALGPVQQLLAGAATSVRGVELLAAQGPGTDALAHAGEAIVSSCAACQQVSGAIGFTLEYPLHRYAQRARALATWNDALIDRGCL